MRSTQGATGVESIAVTPLESPHNSESSESGPTLRPSSLRHEVCKETEDPEQDTTTLPTQSSDALAPRAWNLKVVDLTRLQDAARRDPLLHRERPGCRVIPSDQALAADSRNDATCSPTHVWCEG